MVSAEKFCLRWNDFESNISVAFRELREDKDFFDVTLACDDDQIEAHKVILSACSPFFRTILKRNHHERPLLYLRGVKYMDLMAVLNFMYHGEVNVAQDDLNSFLSIAEDLKVKGLTQSKGDGVSKERHNVNNAKQDLPNKTAQLIQTKKPHSMPPSNQSERLEHISAYQADDDIQEVVPVKTEPVSHPPETQHIQIHDDGQQDQVGDPNLENSIAMYEGNYPDYDNYGEGGDQNYDGAMLVASNVDGNKALDQAISNSMAMVYDEGTNMKVWQCLYCSKTNRDKTAISRHVESHMEGHSHTCNLCHKTYKTRFSLKVHMTREHRGQ